MVTNLLWLITIAGGTFLLGAITAFALLRQRPLPWREKSRQQRKVDKLYHRDRDAGAASSRNPPQ